MSNGGLNQAFVDGQKEKLETLRVELKRMISGMSEDEQDRAEEEESSQFDGGDMSQQMFTREMDATIGEQSEGRLGDVERALEKIEEGTYGVCDDTGDEIPKGRLEAIPEAIRTVDAQEKRGG